MASNPQLEVRFDFVRKELMIRFATEKQAKDYLLKNRESHIFANAGRCDVWLPVLPTMRYIRACSEEIAISFTSEEAARKWSEQSILGHQRQYNKYEVSIKRDRTEAELEKLLKPSEDERLEPGKGNAKDGRPASRHRHRARSPGGAATSGESS